MRSFVLAGLTALLLAGCVSVRYDGFERTPTDSLDVYDKVEDIDRPYKEMGTIEVRGDVSKMSLDRVRDRAVEEAQKRGADAMVVTMAEVRTTNRYNRKAEFEQQDSRPEFGEPDEDETWLVQAVLIAYTDQ